METDTQEQKEKKETVEESKEVTYLCSLSLCIHVQILILLLNAQEFFCFLEIGLL